MKPKNNESLFFVVCDNIRSLENIGSIFRTADAFAIDKIFLCGICGKPPHPKIKKTSLGAEKWIEWEYFSQTWRLIKKLKEANINVVSLEQTRSSISLDEFIPEFPLALVLGNEVRGVSKAILKNSDKTIFLPMYGKKESLNVAVAFGIAANNINKFRLSPRS